MELEKTTVEKMERVMLDLLMATGDYPRSFLTLLIFGRGNDPMAMILLHPPRQHPMGWTMEPVNPNTQFFASGSPHSFTITNRAGELSFSGRCGPGHDIRISTDRVFKGDVLDFPSFILKSLNAGNVR
jgi:hypothetical protein